MGTTGQQLRLRHSECDHDQSPDESECDEAGCEARTDRESRQNPERNHEHDPDQHVQSDQVERSSNPKKNTEHDQNERAGANQDAESEDGTGHETWAPICATQRTRNGVSYDEDAFSASSFRAASIISLFSRTFFKSVGPISSARVGTPKS